MIQQLKQEYDNFYNNLLKKGSLPLRDTKLGFWGQAPLDDLDLIFKKLNIKNKTFLDLGSGDGNVT